MKIYQLDIVIVCAGMEMQGDMLDAGKSLGGSETAAIQMAEALVRLGHRVQMFCTTNKAHEYNGVVYSPMGWIPNRQGGGFPKGFIDYTRATPFDLLIVQRIPSFLSFEMKSKVNFLWQHDLATRSGPSLFHPQLWNIDKILVLSEFMKKQYQSVHGGPDHLYHVTRNGVDLARIDAAPAKDRDRFRLTYTARPERGLDHLLQRVFPEIIKIEPRARLYLSRYDDPQVLPLYQQLDGIIKQFGERVTFMGNLGKQALYEHYKQSRLYLYPSAFEEISCITAMETAACGVPFIGPWRAALPETCKDHGVLIRDDGTSPLVTDPVEPGFKGVSDDFCKAMARKAVELMHDDRKWEDLSAKARRAAENWQWETVAEEWIKLAHDRIAERVNSPVRVVKHFISTSDIIAAKKYAEKNQSTQLVSSVKSYVDRYVPFVNETDSEKARVALNDFYEARSGGGHANWQTGYYAEQEPRLQALMMFLKEHEDEIHTVLDFGCAHGGYARVMSNAFPAIKIVGIDNSPSLIRCCEEMKKGIGPDGQPACKYPENLMFIVGDETLADHPFGIPNPALSHGLKEDAAAIHPNDFDLVVCMEVLEHIPHAEEFAAKLERFCKPDGWMVWTTPTGVKERDELVNKSVPPVHVWAFDMHDLRDMFGHKDRFGVGAFSDLKEIALDKSFGGWFMTVYKNDGQPIGKIDWDRKFFLQGPRETIAVCMMTHNSDTVLRRAAKSVQSIADQFVIIDNGPSTDATVETALEFTEDVRAGTSPFFCYRHLIVHSQDAIQPGVCDMAGFETPRNESISGVWADWIFWIDYDENLLQPGAIFKYLRPNVYYGYAVQQHHLAADAGKLKTDLPVRLFRNGYDIRFYGKVHEHAEFGINRGMGPDISVCNDLNIAHDGYIDEDVRRGRFDRNIRLLQCDRLAYPERTLGKYLYDIRDNVHQARYELELNGGIITPKIAAHLHGVIDMYRKEFLSAGAGNTLNSEGLTYYSEALGILGLGIEVVSSVDIKRQGAQAGQPERFRAIDAEEAKKILASRIDMLAQPLMGPYVA